MAEKTSSPVEALYRFTASSVAALLAETITLPTDVAKTRLQVQQISVTGPRALWKGLVPALVRQVCYSSLSLVLYEPVRNLYAAGFNSVGLRKGASPGFAERLLAGGTAGAVAISVFNPTEVLKTQIMTSKEPKTMHSVIKHIYQSDGIRGFWVGVSPNITRTFLVNAAELGTYDQTKEILKGKFGDGFLTFLGASAVAGFSSAVMSTPADVIKTRMMNSAGGVALYPSMISALVSITQKEGLLALYKGFIPIFIRKIMWCSTFFFVYEKIRIMMRDET